MKMNIDNFETVFFKRQTLLFKALERQKNLFKVYLSDLHRNDGKSFEDVRGFDFNLVHDLEDRLKNRITELQSNYHSLHWDKYNFNTY